MTLSKTDTKAYWKKIGGKEKERANLNNFHDHFKSLAQKESTVDEEGRSAAEEISQREGEVTVEELDRDIHMGELENAIRELKSEKSSGHDNVLNEYLKNASFAVKLLILTIFNSVLYLEYFPSEWAIGSITPVFKGGDKSSTNNYRGITVLSCLGKLFTRIMNNRLKKWAEREEIISEAQFGFRKNRGTVDCIFILQNLVSIFLAKGKRLYCAFIDYQKAYDYLDRAIVWSKLLKNGVSSKSIRIFRNMYSKIQLTVRGDEQCRYFQSRTGLLQGETTSPIFFLFLRK